MAYWLGVDLGTTYSAAAVATSDRVDVVGLGTRSAVIPSVVAVREDGSVLVGEAAERRAAAEPERSAREFKRRLGDPTPLLLGGAPYGAESLTAMLLRAVLEQVGELQGGPPERVALVHPASYGPYKLDLLRLAAEQAGVDDALLVPEPVGAAVHYASLERIEPGEVVAVYDFGGGTFDAAVLRRTVDAFEVIGTPVGLERLGGIDVDEAVLRHVDGSLGGPVAALDAGDRAATVAVRRLRSDCQLAKEALSEDTDTSIPVELPGLSTEVRLTRSELEHMIRPRLDDTVAALQRAVASAGLGLDDVGRILLVGGTSRMPVVREAVAAATGRPVTVDAHPKHSVSLGAAALARASSTATEAVEPEASVAPAAPSAPAPTAPIVVAAPAGRPAKGRRGLLVGAAVLVVLVGVVAALLLGGGDGDDDDLTAGGPTATDGGATTASTAGSATSAPRADIAEVAGLDLPRTVRYADLDVTVESLEVVPGDALTEPALVLVGSLTSPLEHGTVYLAFSTVELVIGDVELVGLASDGPGYAEPGRTVDAVYEFALGDLDPDDLDLAAAVLRVSDAGDVPAELPLGGEPAPESPTAEPVPPAELAAPADQMLFRFTSGTVTLDEGTDLPGSYDAADRRAAEGSGFVRLFGTVTARCVDGCPGGVLATSGVVQLVVDGSPMAPLELTFNEVLVDGQTIDVELVWEVELGAAGYALRVDGGQGTPVDAPIEVPEPTLR
jgi:actin-like ATPase involved in cell morphogenesis